MFNKHFHSLCVLEWEYLQNMGDVYLNASCVNSHPGRCSAKPDAHRIFMDSKTEWKVPGDGLYVYLFEFLEKEL